MKHKIEVVMLPTKDSSNISLGYNSLMYHTHKVHPRKMAKEIMQHLYIMEIIKYPKGGFPIGHSRKIIATTDPKLITYNKRYFDKKKKEEVLL